jgi:hypothetical protein
MVLVFWHLADNLAEVTRRAVDVDTPRSDERGMALSAHTTLGGRFRGHMMLALLFLVLGFGAANALSSPRGPAQLAEARDSAGREPVVLIQSYKGGLSGVRAANPDVHLEVGRDPSISDEPVLMVEYPAPTDDPAGRDVHCDAENQDWTAGHAISFQIKPAHAVRLSLSFVDRNRVVYTTWVELTGGVWQLVRIPFDEIRTNPYFQPPDARAGTPIDVSEVKGIAFAPHDRTAGHLAISKFVVLK